MDDEGDELELRRVLKTLDGSPDDAEAWRRYHLARSLMHRDRGVDVTTDLCAGVMARIEAEPAPQLPAEASSRRHASLPFGGGAAVAAAVSLMVITGVQFYNGSTGPAAVPEVASGTTTTGAPSVVSEVQTVSTAVADIPATTRPAANLPLFQMPISDGLMAVGLGSDAPLFMAPSQRQPQPQPQHAELDQARLLQSYLQRHAEGAAYRSGETWMPLLRASAQEPLSQR